jgi:hypothetical protein
MFRFDPALKVYLHREPVDGRKAINGLALLVEQALGLDPFAPALFVFSNRRRDRIKILLAGWVGQCSALLRALVAANRYVLSGAKVHADDAQVPVLASGEGKTKTGRLLTYVRDDRPAGEESSCCVTCSGWRRLRSAANTSVR